MNSPRRSVLIVDESEDSREVLRTALQQRGLEIFEASEARSGLELARLHHPQLIVIDLEVDSASDPQVCDSYGQQSTDDQSQLLLLGSLRRGRCYPLTEQVVSKPYHYAPLIRKIEELLENSIVAEPTS
ncbi:DNA-binding transcriptional activator KdpE [Lignipirellula cremea]|uniref:DNA-binding transcriptional activator KdpE n=2 Tax=Lignipirellula cremea TaxID=2528010 RepID=A0A518E1C9_9BACT|nr:DNA-binding transcriptional activator KdpE [Lignipirellula cremea]